jgi:hypothetical protein
MPTFFYQQRISKLVFCWSTAIGRRFSFLTFLDSIYLPLLLAEKKEEEQALRVGIGGLGI